MIAKVSGFQRFAPVAFAMLISGCDPGSVQIKFIWEGGRPTYPEEADARKTTFVQQRKDPRVPGPDLVPPVTIPFSQIQSTVENVPYGEDRVLINEVRVGGELAHYGISDPFSVHRGDHIVVSIFMQPTEPPQPLPPELGASLVIVSSTIAPGYVNHPNVDLLITAPASADRVRLSNIVGQPEGKSLIVELATLERVEGAPDEYQTYRFEQWNIERDLEDEPCVDRNRCRREVFASFLDAQNYQGRPIFASVILDEVPPRLIAELTSVVPEVARQDSFVVVNLTASEVVTEPALEVAQRVTFPFSRVSPTYDAPSASYTFTSSTTAGAIGRNDTFLIRATMRDLAGNLARHVEVGTFRVDGVLPTIHNVEVEPARINGELGRRAVVRFVLNKAARYTVAIGDRAMDACAEVGRAPQIFVTCERGMRGDEIPVGQETVEAISIAVLDDAGHVANANATIVFDFRAPSVYAARFSPEASNATDGAQLYIAANEPLAPDFVPEIAWDGMSAPFVHVPGRDTDFERYYELAAPISIAAAEYGITGLSLRDEAGNETRSSTVSARWLFDPTPPEIRDLIVTVRGGAPVDPPRVADIAGTVIDISFTEIEEHPANARVILLGTDLAPACTISGVAPIRLWTCTYTTTGDEFGEIETAASISVEVSDVARNVASATAPLIFDYLPPDIVASSVSLTLRAGADNLLRRIPGPTVRIDRVGVGTTAIIGFVMSEPVREAPILASTPDPLAFTITEEAGTSFVYQHTLEVPATQGAYLFEVTATDIAGNTVTHELTLPAPGVVVDTISPSAPNTLTMTFERYPWGSDATGDGPSATVEGEIGSVEPNAIVAITANRELAQLDLLGYTRSIWLGAVQRFTLDRTEDRTEVFVVVIDSAGNSSPSTTGVPGTASRIRRGVWNASFRAQLPGQGPPNPHRVLKLHELEPSLAQHPAMVSAPSASEVGAIAGTDGQSLNATTIRHWEEMLLSASQPTGRERSAMAYDAARGVTVMFGGFGRREETMPGMEDLRDTWEWDGRRWNQLNPAGAIPPARAGHAMVYDAIRGRMILFGGTDLDDTWAFDGNRWQEITNAQHPSARTGHAMVYDSDRGVVLLFGGRDQSGPRNDLWSLDDDEWTLIEGCASATCPAGRTGAGMVFVPGTPTSLSSVRVVGGATTRLQTPFADAWSWNGSSWSQLSNNVPAREGAAYVRNSDTGDLLYFGGQANGLHNTLHINGTAYTPAFEEPPPARDHAASTYDARHHRMIVFGGVGEMGELLNTVWTFTGNAMGRSWRELTPSFDRPSPRRRAAMAYDRAMHEVVLFGGLDTSSPGLLAETWTWNGARWSRSLDGANARQGHAMAGDGFDCLLLFGGSNSAPAPLQMTELRRVEFWTPMSRASSCRVNASSVEPPGRFDFAMTTVGSTVLLFSGLESSSSPLPDTWEWSNARGVGAEWSNRSSVSANNPPARGRHAMASRDGRGVLFGGWTDAQGAVPFANVWEWTSGNGWSQVPTSGPEPGPRYWHAMVEDVHRGRVLLVGGFDVNDQAKQDTWEWDGANWSELQPQAAPPARNRHAMAYDHDRDRVVLFGDGEMEHSEVWELHADPDQRPGLQLNFDWSSLGVALESVRSLEARATAGGVGYSETGASVAGVELAIWNSQVGAWETRSTNLASLVSPAPISRTVSQFAELRSVVTPDGQLILRLRARAGIGRGPGESQVAADVAELRVNYELAD